MEKRGILGCALLVALTACGGGADPTPSIQDCGVEDQQMGTNMNVEGRRCLLTAFEEGRPARFVSRMTSIEGDPIIRTYVVVSAGEVQIEHDASRDRFGGTLDVLRCPRIVPVADWNRAMGEEMRAEEVFVEDSCEVISSRGP